MKRIEKPFNKSPLRTWRCADRVAFFRLEADHAAPGRRPVALAHLFSFRRQVDRLQIMHEPIVGRGGEEADQHAVVRPQCAKVDRAQVPVVQQAGRNAIVRATAMLIVSHNALSGASGPT